MPEEADMHVLFTPQNLLLGAAILVIGIILAIRSRKTSPGEISASEKPEPSEQPELNGGEYLHRHH